MSSDEQTKNGEDKSNNESTNGQATSGADQNSSSFRDLRDADFSELDNPKAASGGDSSAAVAKLEAELAEMKDKYLRSIAEMENYKKRTMRERTEMLKYQGERILSDLITVLDNIELAVSHKDGPVDELKKGLELIQKMFVDTLGRWEVRPVSGLGTKYDPNRYEALSYVPVDNAEPGTIINEGLKAYMYKDKLLRPGKVVVAAQKKAAESVPAAESDSTSAKE